MPFQSTDTTTTIQAAASGEVWVIKAGVYVAPTTIGFNSNFGNVTLSNYGMISAGSHGVDMSGGPSDHLYNAVGGEIYGDDYGVIVASNSNVINAGVISGSTALYLQSGETRVNNSGQLTGSAVGIAVDQGLDTTISNSGQITGAAFGISDSQIKGEVLAIANSGLISGARGGIYFYVSTYGGIDLTNTGTVEGDIALGPSQTANQIHNTGSIAGDLIFGSVGDLYDGRRGDISGSILGGDGNDTLIGGANGDVIDGGTGRDRLDGGKGGGDVFMFDSAKDSSTRSPDLIAGHWDASDTIDLSALDANSSTGGNQAFGFDGQVANANSIAAFSVGYFHDANATYVVADTSGDGKADFEVVINGTYTLTADQFVL